MQKKDKTKISKDKGQNNGVCSFLLERPLVSTLLLSLLLFVISSFIYHSTICCAFNASRHYGWPNDYLTVSKDTASLQEAQKVQTGSFFSLLRAGFKAQFETGFVESNGLTNQPIVNLFLNYLVCLAISLIIIFFAGKLIKRRPLDKSTAFIIIILIMSGVIGLMIRNNISRQSEVLKSIGDQLSVRRVTTVKPKANTAKVSPEMPVFKNDRYGFEINLERGLKTQMPFKMFYMLSNRWCYGADEKSKGQPIVSIPIYQVENKDAFPRYFSAEVRIGASADPEDVKNCLKRPGTSMAASKVANIGGLKFLAFPIAEAGMMQYVSGTSYRIIHNNTCFAIEQLKSGSNYRDQPNPKDIPESVLDSYFQKAGDLIKTFKFIK